MAATLESVQQIAEANPEDFDEVTDEFQSFIDLANELAEGPGRCRFFDHAVDWLQDLSQFLVGFMFLRFCDRSEGNLALRACMVPELSDPISSYVLDSWFLIPASAHESPFKRVQRRQVRATMEA